MDGYWLDWINLIVRWVHVITGIAWIGASFYFVWLDNSIQAPTDEKLKAMGVSGELWAVHGGGFYNPQKYIVAPKQLPEHLHWFYWESYSTWLSGFSLLVFLYYLQASTYMVDPSVMALSASAAIGLSLTYLVGGWIVYDILCRLLQNKTQLLFIVLFAVLSVMAWSLTQVFSGRAAFLHMGAIIATIMSANVLMVIIPGQRKVVAQMREGLPVDPRYGQKAKQRSVHNNYLTLPVLFAMISNHYAFLYTHRWSWLILIAVLLVGGMIRLFFNLKHKGKSYWSIWAIVVVIALAIAWIVKPTTPVIDQTSQVSMDQIRNILNQRCVICHAENPSFAGFSSPPMDVRLDDETQIKRNLQRIYDQSVKTRAMPLGNITQMTEQERELLAKWALAENVKP